MCAMMQKFRMNFGSIFLAYQFSQLRAGCERSARFSGGPAAFERATHAAQKPVPYKHSVCHISQAASACPPISDEGKSGVTRAGPGNCGPFFFAEIQSYLTDGLCRHRVSAI